MFACAQGLRRGLPVLGFAAVIAVGLNSNAGEAKLPQPAFSDRGAALGAETKSARPAPDWAFQAVRRPAEPKVSTPRFKRRNPVDAFVAAKLAEHKLSLSPAADRRTLIRRLYFDLIGLPPSPEEVQAFLADADQNAYEKLVERLLASPRYGERWARHWLDVVRFAETHGFEMNQPRPNAWRYRDYVIGALNEDQPYDQFVAEQLAGDALGADAATGFLVAGAFDQVKSPDPVLTANQRADELHDLVSATGSAFLGLTVGCARCHDHKFDPIPQTDYYALKAVFAGVQHGERKLRTAETAAREREAAERRQALEDLERALDQFEPLSATAAIDTNRLRAPVNARRNVERFTPRSARRLRFTINKTTDVEPCLDELEVFTAEPAPRNVALASAGGKVRASGVFPNSELHRLEHLNDGRYGNSRSWISNEPGRGWVELEFPNLLRISKVVWGRDREERFADRLAVDYRIEVATGADDWELVASSADRAPYVANSKTKPADSPAGVDLADQERLKELLSGQARLKVRLKELANIPMVYAGTFDAQPETTYRLFRGDPMQRREVVAPGVLSALSRGCRSNPVAEIQGQGGATKHCFTFRSCRTLTPPTSEQQRRLALAKWIVSPNKPLTARVLVNRLWQYHFGEGLVNTPSDFGANGARPSHPELLDWLAAEFVQPQCLLNQTSTPWSLKHIHRLIVTSAAYRQSSRPRTAGLAMDATAHWLWRFPPRRLEAEPIRDAILAVSGKLDLRMGGPGFSFFEPNENYVRVYIPKQEFGPEDWRRTIYGTIVRQRPDGVFGAFDCPDGGQIAPKRTRSTTPLQALNLLNSAFIMQQAGFFAERLQRECGDKSEAAVRRAFALAFQREADRAEVSAAVRLVRAQGLKVFCRALFNANEFVYLF